VASWVRWFSFLCVLSLICAPGSGTTLSLTLAKAGHKVTVVDDLSSGQRKNADLLVANGITFVEGDILTLAEFPRAQQIYHLACPASPPFYQADPVRTWKISVLGTLRVAEWALKIGARILFTSTSEVYGDPLQHPQKESYWGNVNPIGIRSCYDEGKRATETLLMDMHRAKSAPLNVCIARLFNTYGPHMDPKDGRVVSNLILQALRGEPMTVYGSGDQVRRCRTVCICLTTLRLVRFATWPTRWTG
jgi:UDP-glucuronate decarboxylase